MIDAGRLKVIDAIASCARGSGVLLAELNGHMLIGGALNKYLRDAKRERGRGRGRRVALRHLGWSRAQQFYHSIVAQVQLIGQREVKHACQADRAGKGQRLFKWADGALYRDTRARGQPEGQ